MRLLRLIERRRRLEALKAALKHDLANLERMGRELLEMVERCERR